MLKNSGFLLTFWRSATPGINPSAQWWIGLKNNQPQGAGQRTFQYLCALWLICVGAPGIELGEKNGLPLASGFIFCPIPVVNGTPEPEVLDEKKRHGKNRNLILLIRHKNINTFFRV